MASTGSGLTKAVIDVSDEDTISLTSTIEPDTYRVQSILAERVEDDAKQFLIKWTDYDSDECSWEPADNIDHASTVVIEWVKCQQEGRNMSAHEVKALGKRMRTRARELSAAKQDRTRRRREKKERMRKRTAAANLAISSAIHMSIEDPVYSASQRSEEDADDEDEEPHQELCPSDEELVVPFKRRRLLAHSRRMTRSATRELANEDDDAAIRPPAHRLFEEYSSSPPPQQSLGLPSDKDHGKLMDHDAHVTPNKLKAPATLESTGNTKPDSGVGADPSVLSTKMTADNSKPLPTPSRPLPTVVPGSHSSQPIVLDDDEDDDSIAASSVKSPLGRHAAQGSGEIIDLTLDSESEDAPEEDEQKTLKSLFGSSPPPPLSTQPQQPLAERTPSSTTASGRGSETAERSTTQTSLPAIRTSAHVPQPRVTQPKASGSSANGPQGARFKNLRTENRHQKFVRDNELVPDINSLTFVDPKTGRVSEPATKTMSPTPAAKKKANMTPPARTTVAATPTVGRQGRVVLETNKDQQTLPRTEAPPTLSLQIPTDQDKMNPTWVRQNVTCRHWLKHGSCSFDNCRFAHSVCHLMQPKEDKTCQYWRKGKACRFAEGLCDYHHSLPDPETGKFPAQDFSAIELAASNAVVDRVGDDISCDATSSNGSFNHAVARLSSDLTCRFWYNGVCNKNDAECKYVHACTDTLAPKMRVTCTNWYESRCKFTAVSCPYFHCRASQIDAESSKWESSKTCQDWKNGHCLRSADRCPNHHGYWDVTPRENDTNTLSNPSDDDLGNLPDAPLVADIGPTIPTGESSAQDNAVPSYILCGFGPDQIPLKRRHGGIGRQGQVVDVCILGMCLRSDLQAWRKPSTSNLPRPLEAEGSWGSERLRTLSTQLETHDCRIIARAEDKLVAIDVVGPVLTMTVVDEILVAPDFYRPCESPQRAKTSMLESWARLNVDRLFVQTNGAIGRKIVCLMFPESCTAEIRLLTSYLGARGVSVYLPISAKGWTAFRDHGKATDAHGRFGGTILFHPDFEAFHRITKFANLLKRQYYTMFRFDIKYAYAEANDCLTRLFGYGNAVLITDEAILDDTIGVLDVLENFYRKAHARDFQVAHRIYTRPSVERWIKQLAERTNDQARRAILDTIRDILEKLRATVVRATTHRREDDSLLLPQEGEGDYFQVLYETLYQKSQQEATEVLVHYYSCWTLSRVEDLRLFSVLLPPRKTTNERTDTVAESHSTAATTPVERRRATSNDTLSDHSMLQKWQSDYKHLWFTTSDEYMQERRRHKTDRKSPRKAPHASKQHDPEKAQHAHEKQSPHKAQQKAKTIENGITKEARQ